MKNNFASNFADSKESSISNELKHKEHCCEEKHHHDEHCNHDKCGGHDNKPHKHEHGASCCDREHSDDEHCKHDKCGGHNHEDGCSCQKERGKSELIKNIIVIGIALALFVLGITLPIGQYVKLAFFIPAYLIVGWEYIFNAIKNIFRGKIFDENFLMTLATVVAFAIGEYAEASLVMLLYYIGETFQSLAVSKSKKSVSALLNLKSEKAHKLVDGGIVDIDCDDLVVGDIISVGAGEKLPTDGIVLEGEAWLDYSALNGEYMPKSATKGFSALGGSILKEGVLKLEVTQEFKNTTAAKIIELVESSQDKKPKSEKFISRFAKWYTPCVVLIALIVAFVVPIFTGYEHLSEWVHRALIFLVISCPCALVISIPLSFFAGIGGASKGGALVKGSNNLDEVNNIDTVVFDKTGTLTMGTPVVTQIIAEDKERVAMLAALAEVHSTHPLAIALRANYSDKLEIERVSDYKEIAGKGISAKIDNNDILCGSAKLLNSYGIEADLPISENGTMIYVAENGVYIGAVDINDEIKPEAKSLIETLKKRQINVIMMTGDEQRSANFVASKLGIENVYSGLLPDEKAKLICDLNDKGKKVMFVGDGLNDAPVLSLAYIGVCISGLNNDASIEASDVVIIGGLNAVKNLFITARKTKNIVVQNIVFSLAVKVAIMVLSFTVLTQMWLAILADVGVSLLAIANAIRALRIKKD